MSESKDTAILAFFTGDKGAGWYYWDQEYPEEGACGPFGSDEEAEAHALKAYDCVERATLTEPEPE